MPLPDLIEIIPLAKPVHAEITVPGSKSITNRALILAALADGETVLQGALWSEDTQVMVDCLEKLGFEIKVELDANEFCNRTITVRGLGGKILNGGTAEKPLELFVGNAGTAARFLSALVCLGNGVYRLSGVPRMHERPQAALFQALRELGCRVEAENGNDKLPVKISHRGTESTERNPFSSASSASLWQNRKCQVSIEESSQFASALLLCAKTGNWEIKIKGENADESPYVAMTSEMIKVFPQNGGTFQIEPDASSGSYFVAAGELFGSRDAWPIIVSDWPTSSWQIDTDFVSALPLPPVLSRGGQSDDGMIHLGDSLMTAIVLTPFAIEPCIFYDLGRLRLQETERVFALRTELTKCGAKVIEEGDTLTVYPSKLHGAEIETYHDHRMAMCFAILGLKVPGIKIKNPACVKKTFPNFFQKLAAEPPHGLGVKILDAKTEKQLSHEELFAD
ncbi:MAG: 3-phosphoshikimate 1-carboxyvinyltransferase [Verrucomicrobiota bacterium]